MSQSSPYKRLIKTLVLLQGFWILTILVFLVFNLNSAHQEVLNTAEAAAEATISRDLSIRSWAAEKGGVYIVHDGKTPPNPYLKHPHRDLTTQEDLQLTLLNPAYLLRDIQQNSPDDYGVRTFLVSENPLNPINQADDWETQALQKFADNPEPLHDLQVLDDKLYLRKIQPFMVEPGCMGCHAHQGYQLGEVRGGISAAIPMAPYLARYEQHNIDLYSTHLGVWLLGFLGLAGGYINQRKNLNHRQQQQQKLQLAAEAFQYSDEGILITDAETRILDVNQAFERISGYSKQELLGQTPQILNSGRQGPEVYRDMWQTLENQGHWQGEVWNRSKDGEVYAVSLTISALYDENDPPRVRNFLALSADITGLKNKEYELNRLAHYDTLTELPNRLLLTERMQQAMKRVDLNNHFLAVALLDLDGFKRLNEQYGHQAGDLFLIDLSQRLLKLVGEQGILSRISGDEFALVIHPLASRSDSEPLLNEILECVSEPLLAQDQVLKVTASMGVTFYPSDSVDAEQLLRHADQAMYAAKQEGKNCYTFFDPLQERAVRNISSLVKEVKQALENQEFVLFYQPKVYSTDHQLIGAEALIRWQHPKKGLMAPGQFLPMIEQHPVMLEVGRWVMRTALEQLKSWYQLGIQCPVSINLNSQQIQQTDFLVDLSELLEEYPEVEPAHLEIEVLETTAVEDMPKVSRALQGIRDLGVLVSIDDFGTGYSSLTYLKHLPVNTLKIDQSFVHDLLDDLDDLAIVQGVISMAAAFKLNVIAEGVETRQHGLKLLELGCVQVQGYGVSRPLAADQFEQWLEGWKVNPRWLQ